MQVWEEEWKQVPPGRYTVGYGLIAIQLSKDGDQWCALYGEDLQTGIAGFGKTQREAVENFLKELAKPPPVSSPLFAGK